MSHLLFTPAEQAILLPLAQQRLQEWDNQYIVHATARKRFRQSYLFPLRSAIAKITAAVNDFYGPMEKAILAGCLRDQRNLVLQYHVAEELVLFDGIALPLLAKLDPRKKRFADVYINTFY